MEWFDKPLDDPVGQEQDGGRAFGIGHIQSGGKRTVDVRAANGFLSTYPVNRALRLIGWFHLIAVGAPAGAGLPDLLVPDDVEHGEAACVGQQP